MDSKDYLKNQENIDKLKKIKILVMDVDGTLTDSGVFYSKSGEEMKRFSLRDGMGIELIHKAGLEAAILTSENSPLVIARSTKLKIEHVILGSRNKKKSLQELADTAGVTLENLGYIGDDVNDYFAVQTAGFSACPADAVDCVRDNVDYICNAKGGYGAVREFAELILTAQDKPIILPESW